MNWGKVFALSLRHIYLIKGSFPRILDLIYWPTIQIFLWGFISKFFTLSSSYFENTVGIILSAAILYDFLFRSSISYNMMFLEEIWSRNFTNLFISPIKHSEIITDFWSYIRSFSDCRISEILTIIWNHSLGEFIFFSTLRMYLLSYWNITRVASSYC